MIPLTTTDTSPAEAGSSVAKKIATDVKPVFAGIVYFPSLGFRSID
jgi:hypothetical protein